MGIKQTDLINVWSARGGHGATTVAGAIGRFLDTTVRCDDSAAFAWVWGESLADTQSTSPEIADAGALGGHISRTSLNVAVVRGPSSFGILSVRQVVGAIDHMILIHEPWRSIGRGDLEAALLMPIEVEIPHSPRIARLIDAGLLGEKLDELDEFDQLRDWSRSKWLTKAHRATPPPS